MRFEILGPLLVWDGGARLSIGGQRQQRLLAALLLQAGRPVPSTRLSTVMWNDHPPATARAQLHNAVASLRRALRSTHSTRSAHIVRGGSGFAIQLAGATLDLVEFDRRVAAASQLTDAAAAVHSLRAALDLWRGPALDGIGDGILAAQARLLDYQRLDCVERRIALELDLGRHNEVCAELAALSAEHPLRERLAWLWMLALYRAGRRSEALSVYAEARRALVEHTGLDPSGELMELHRGILRADPILAVPQAAGSAAGHRGGAEHTVESSVGAPAPRAITVAQHARAQLPLDIYGFTGRVNEIAQLDANLASADEQSTAVIISALWGTAGVGKTALAVHWAHRVAGRFPDGQLYLNMRGFDAAGLVMTTGEAIRILLAALGVRPATIPAELAAQTGLYRGLLAGKRVLVVLDNVRDAEQVRPLLPGAPGCVVVVTSRNQLPGLVVAQGAHPVVLDLLTTMEARELLTRRLGARLEVDPAVIDDLVVASARLPLALAIVAARATVNPSIPIATLADTLLAARGSLGAFGGDDVVTDLRAVFSWSYQTLSADAARLFRLLGLQPGPDVGVAAAASLAGVPVERVSLLLAELLGANLVNQPATDRFAFHDLLRAYAIDQAMTHDHAELAAARHRMFDHYLHTAYAADRLLFPARDSIPLAGPEPGVVVANLIDHDDALAWFSMEHPALLAVVEEAVRQGFDRHAWQVAWTLTIFFDLQGYREDWVATQRAAVAATRRLSDRSAQALTLRGLARACVRMGLPDDARAHLCEALELFTDLGDLAGQAHTHLNLGRWFAQSGGSYAEALTHAGRALELFRAADHRAGQASALNGLGWFHAQLGNYDSALGYCDQARALQHELGDLVGEAATWDSIAYAHHHLGRYREAIACYEQSLGLLRGIGDRYNEADTLGCLADALDAAGEPHAAHATRESARRILDELGRLVG